MRLLLFVLIMYGAISVWAQVNSFLTVEFQNDFLDCWGHGTDRYYTAGNRLQYLSSLKNEKLIYGIGVLQKVYTPSDLQDSSRRYTDYPYAGLLFMEGTLRYTDINSNWYSIVSLSLGEAGKASGAEIFQRGLHRLLGDEMPRGWQHILELGMYSQFSWSFEKKIAGDAHQEMGVFQHWEWGTVFKNVKLGLSYRNGVLPVSNINQYSSNWAYSFRSDAKTDMQRRFSFYVTPVITWVISNKILERGLLNPGYIDRPLYGLSKISKVLLEIEAGAGYHFSRLALLYHQNWQQREFSSGLPHHYGSIAVVMQLHHKTR